MGKRTEEKEEKKTLTKITEDCELRFGFAIRFDHPN